MGGWVWVLFNYCVKHSVPVMQTVKFPSISVENNTIVA